MEINVVKRIVSMLLLTLICLPIFSGCSEREVIPIEYTSEILVKKELPEDELVWAGRFVTPLSGVGLLPYSESDFLGIVGQHTIKTVPTWKEEKKYFKLAYPYANDYIADLTRIKREKLREKFNLVIRRENAYIWEDVSFFHFYVPEDDVYEERSTEYAGKYVFIEYSEKEETVYTSLLIPEEYSKNGIQSDYVGRIGNIVYFESGFYDLVTHKYVCYESEAELPPYKFESSKRHKEIRDILRQNEILAELLNSDGVYSADRYYLMNDRIYAAFVIGESYHYEPDGGYEEYEGSDLLLVMLDADTYELLYAEKFHSKNYYMGNPSAGPSGIINMYRMGTDGLLYDLYILE